jgi:hypothetical protein
MCNGNSTGSANVECQATACGDNYVNLAAGETCDRGLVDTASCNGSTAGTASCHFPSCGDGYVNTDFKPMSASRTEECDMGAPCADITKTCTNCNCI